jgi:hypothetical protein
VSLKKRGRLFDSADPLTKDFTRGMLDIFVGFDAGDRDIVGRGAVRLTRAVRDIASRGELRVIEEELSQLLEGMVGRRDENAKKRRGIS